MKISASIRRSESGFTLVELLLAITLLGILMGLTYGGLKVATRATASGQVQLAESGKVRITHQFIRRQLHQMQPLPFDISDDINETRVVFEGSAKRIQFVAPMPGYLGQGGPQVQTLELVNGADGLDLLFNHQLLQGYDSDLMIEREPIVLLEAVQQASFEFLAANDDGELAGWTSSWDTPGILPLAVRLDFDLGAAQRSVWPLLVTSVKVDELATTQSGASQAYSDVIRGMIEQPSERRQ